jgi:hypothetical protein
MAAGKALATALLALAFCASTTSALELARGRMKLTLHEGMGRFSIAYQTDPAGGVYKPLLFEKDPRTSVTCLSAGGKVYRLGESKEFHETVERTSNGARFKWSSAFLSVTEEFTFLTDAIRIDLTLKNVSQKDLDVGVRSIFDTYLGEPSNVHFMTDKLAEMSHETTITSGEKPAYWVSPLVGDPGKLGLMRMLSGNGITPPDRVVFANWKRLYDASWGYETSAARNFNLMPYSVNDSAVSEYFDPRRIPRGSEWKITSVMGKYVPSGIEAGSAIASEDKAPPPQAVIPPKAAADSATAHADLQTVDAIISEIDAGIASAASVTEEQLAALSKKMAELKSRSAGYAKGSGK